MPKALAIFSDVEENGCEGGYATQETRLTWTFSFAS